MLFSLNGSEFMVKFERNNDVTVAKLFEFDADKNLYDLLIHGRSVRKHNDKFSKSIGRKKALANLFKVMNQTKVTPYVTTKQQRTEIWKIYFKEHKK